MRSLGIRARFAGEPCPTCADAGFGMSFVDGRWICSRCERELPMKMSWDAKVILTLLAEAGIGTALIPRDRGNWCNATAEHVRLYGSGHATILRNFVKRGLAKWVPELGGERAYTAAITEDGMLLYEQEVRFEVERK